MGLYMDFVLDVAIASTSIFLLRKRGIRSDKRADRAESTGNETDLPQRVAEEEQGQVQSLQQEMACKSSRL